MPNTFVRIDKVYGNGATTLAALFGLFSGQNNLTDSVEVAAAWLNKSQGTKHRILGMNEITF